MIYDITHALTSLYPGRQWHLIGDAVYANIVWTDSSEKPTEQELLDEVARLQSEYDIKEYQRLRAKDYPSIVDQLDALYHVGYDGWKALVQQTKDKYPK
jgi:tRNA A37 N6-isopentenylltransferase MiaA